MAERSCLVAGEYSRRRAHGARIAPAVSSRSTLREGEPSGRASPSSWRELVGLLALGSKSEVRECPVCKHIGLRPATLCGSCWERLTQPAPRSCHVA